MAERPEPQLDPAAARQTVAAAASPSTAVRPAGRGLRVGAADDRYEREADAAAAMVVARLRSGDDVARRAASPGLSAQPGDRSAAGPVVRRLMSPEDFKTATYQRFAKRGEAVQEIDKLLVEYQPLVTGKQTRSALRKREQLLLQMQYAADQWIKAHEIDGEEDPKRKDRMIGMRKFLRDVGAELGIVQQRKDDDFSEAAVNDVDPKLAGKGYKRLKQKYEGDATSTFDKLAFLIDMSVPNPGDQSEIEIEFRWPVDPSGIAFVGGRLKATAQRDAAVGEVAGSEARQNLVVRTELAVTGGGQWVSGAELKAELGVYLESSAKTARECTTLASYAVYRRWRESYVLPEGAANLLWGGRTGAFGKKKSEKWSNDVEKTIMDDKSAYVETGALLSASGQVGLSDRTGKGKAGLTFTAGTRYDRESVKSAKGALGADNKLKGKPRGTQAQESLGKSAYVLEFAVEGSGGILTGGAGFKAKWMGNKSKDKVDAKSELDSFELNGKFKAAVPNVGHEKGLEHIIRYIIPGVMAFVGMVRRSVATHRQRVEAEKAKMDPKKLASTEQGHKATWAGQVLSLAETGVPVLAQVQNLGDVTQAFSADPASTLSQKASFGDAMGSNSLTSTAGLALSLGWDVKGGDVQLSLNFEKDLDFAVPLFLKVHGMKTERLISFKWSKRENPKPGESSYKFEVA